MILTGATDTACIEDFKRPSLDPRDLLPLIGDNPLSLQSSVLKLDKIAFILARKMLRIFSATF